MSTAKAQKNTIEKSPDQYLTHTYQTTSILVSLSLVFILLNALGFPGGYRRVIGESAGMAIEYLSFGLQILLMIMSSGKNVRDVKIIDLKADYRSIYFIFVLISAGSMIAAYDKGEEIISCIRICTTALFAIWLCQRFSVEEILEKVYYAQILFILASVAFPVLFPGYDTRGASYQDAFVGISGVKNVVGAELSFGIIMMSVLLRIKMYKGKRVTKLFIIIYLFQFLLLYRTNATGAMLIAIVLSSYILIVDRIFGKRIPIGIIYVIGTIAFLVMALNIIPIFESFLTALGKDATLTGRIPLWNQVIAVMKENNTVLGFGYGLFWRDPNALALMHAGFEKNSWAAGMTSGAHNNLLELWANTGMLGVVVFFIGILLAFRNITKRTIVSPESYIFCVGYMSYYMICGWTERCLTTYEYDILFLCIAMALACTRKGINNVQQTNCNSGSNNIQKKLANNQQGTEEYRKPDCFRAEDFINRRQ